MPAISFKVYVLNISILACIYCFTMAAFMVSLFVSIDRPQDSVAVNNQTWQVCKPDLVYGRTWELASTAR